MLDRYPLGVYNAENTLREAINSIINQTYSNWELIICDDGSTDNSYNLAQSFSDKRIIVIRNEKNMGLGYTLNRCIERAKGSIIARMDADDMSLPSRLEKQYQFMKNHPEYGVVGTAITRFDSKGDIWTESVIAEPEPSDFIVSNPIKHPSCMMKRECLDLVKGYSESINTLRVEDTDLWIRMLRRGIRFYVMDEALYRFRFDENTIKRQKLIYRWNGAIVKVKGCKSLKLPIKYFLLSFKPVAIGLIPAPVRYTIHKKRMKDRK